VDLARTWLDFLFTPFRALAALGIELTEAEQNSLYQYWHYIAYLLGLEDSFYRDVTDHDSARELGHLFDSTIGAPDENSRALTAAMVGAQVELLASAPQPLMPRAEFSGLIHGILRRTFGDELADQLGIPVSSAAPFLVMIALANRETRRWQTFTPQSAARALQENIARWSANDRSPDIPGGPTYQRHARTGTVGAEFPTTRGPKCLPQPIEAAATARPGCSEGSTRAPSLPSASASTVTGLQSLGLELIKQRS
jgi:hypothetical protein